MHSIMGFTYIDGLPPNKPGQCFALSNYYPQCGVASLLAEVWGSDREDTSRGVMMGSHCPAVGAKAEQRRWRR